MFLFQQLQKWWSDKVFAGTDAAGSEHRSFSIGFALAMLLFVTSVLSLARLGCPLLEPEEARYAEIPRQMLVEGNWVEPTLHGQPYYQKPPLFYWLVMTSYRAFGVYDWAARLVPATCTILTVIVVYFWGLRTAGPLAGFFGGLMLSLAPRFLYLSGMLVFDSVLCLWVIIALAAAHISMTDRFKLPWWLTSALACGLGILTKGPVALVLIVGPIIVWLLLERRARRPSILAFVLFPLTALIVAAPWFVAVAMKNPDAMQTFFFFHNVQRFIAPFDHAKPFWYYIPGILLGLAPWTFFLIPFAKYLLQTRATASRRRPPALGFYLLSFLVCFAFFSASGCKRAAYILPALPSLALAFGTCLAKTVPWTRLTLLRLRGDIGGKSKSLGLQLLTVAAVLSLSTCMLATVSGLCDVTTGVWVWTTTLVASVLVLRWANQRPAIEVAASCVVVLFVTLLVGVTFLLPAYHRRFALRDQVQSCRSLGVETDIGVGCYPRGWDSVSFYLQRDRVRIFDPARSSEMIDFLRRSRKTLVFVKRRHLQAFRDSIHTGLRFVTLEMDLPKVVVGLVVSDETSLNSASTGN